MTARVRRRVVELDRIDHKILDVLQGNARLTFQKLSELVGLTPRPCLERVRRLEASGVIRGYTTQIDPALVGYPVVALASLRLRDNVFGARERLERHLLSAPSVVELLVPSGDCDFIARIVATSLDAYEALTATWLDDVSLGIQHIATTFVMRTARDFRGYPRLNVHEVDRGGTAQTGR